MTPKLAKNGTSFKGAASYYLHDKEADSAERVEWTETHNIGSRNPETAWKIMAATAIDQDRLKSEAGISKAGRKSKDCVLALSLSWHPEEKEGLTKADMMEAAKGAIKALGAEKHQALIIAHNDTAHPHVHIIINRVSPENGVMLPSKFEKENLSKWAGKYEADRGKIYCAERVKNAERREMLGEFTRAAKDRPRHIFEQEKGLAASTKGQQTKSLQRNKDAELNAKGRALALKHQGENEKLKSDYKDRQQTIRKETAREIVKITQQARNERTKAFSHLQDRQQIERRRHGEREKRVDGKIKNAVEAIKGMKGVRHADSARGFLTNAFNFMVSSQARKVALDKRQAAEKRAFVSRPNKQLNERIAAARTEEKAKHLGNAKQTRTARQDLRQRHTAERKQLGQEWKQRTAERAQSWGAVRASKEARQQTAARFSRRESQVNQNTRATSGDRGSGNSR